jgi:hypothetical protein
MQETKIRILGVAGGLLMTMALIAALDAYVTRIHATAPRAVVELERVTVTAERPAAQNKALAETEARKAKAL